MEHDGTLTELARFGGWLGDWDQRHFPSVRHVPATSWHRRRRKDGLADIIGMKSWQWVTKTAKRWACRKNIWTSQNGQVQPSFWQCLPNRILTHRRDARIRNAEATARARSARFVTHHLRLQYIWLVVSIFPLSILRGLIVNNDPDWICPRGWSHLPDTCIVEAPFWLYWTISGSDNRKIGEDVRWQSITTPQIKVIRLYWRRMETTG